MTKRRGTKQGAMQLEVPRPGHIRSTSTSSIPNNLDPFVPPTPSSSVPNVGCDDTLLSRPDVPPNTSQTRSGMVTPAAGAAGSIVPNASMTTILAGDSGKPFKFLTDLLTSRSPYFRELFGTPARRDSIINLPITTTPPEASDATLVFPELNEFAFALFNRWLYGAQLSGPSDFHTMQHYFGLYVLATRFRIEKLENEVMDLVRAYYRASNMSCPPYRLEYIYENTKGPNKMRDFLVATVMQRVVAEGGMSNVMRDVLGQGGDLTMDFIDALIVAHGRHGGDVRKGRDCAWHKHVETRSCRRLESED